MKIKKSLMLGIFLSMFIFSMSLVVGAITFDAPTTAGDTVTGIYSFNVTSTLAKVHYCNWSTTADINFVGVQNESDDIFNVTFDTTGLTEAEDTTLTVNCSIEAGTTSEINTLVINVDNTNPVCAFQPDAESTTYLNPIGIATTQLSTDTTDLTYAWILYDPSMGSQQTSVSSAPTFSGEDFDEKGTFIISLIVTDEASLTHACTNKTILVKGKDEAGEIVGEITTQIRGRDILWIVLVIILIIIVITVSFYLISYKKRR